MESMIMPYRRYADFSGRSGRQEYWMFVLFSTIVFAVAMTLLFGGLASMQAGQAPASPLFWLGLLILVVFSLGSIIPSIAVQVRRFHDQDKSGWFALLGLVPYAGGLIILVFMCLEGTRGPNRFGPDPRDPYNADVFG